MGPGPQVKIGWRIGGCLAGLAAACMPLAAMPAPSAGPPPLQTIAQVPPAKKTTRGRPTAARPSPAPAAADLSELSQWCQAVGQRLVPRPREACVQSELQAGEGRSVRGVPLWFRDIAPADSAPRLRVLLVGGIHGDEKASVQLVLDWLTRIRREPERPVHWRIVPLLNPDGLLRQPATRTNARGVDLNRNFPTADWESDAQRYWIKRTRKDPRRYPGPSAMSEPETQWLHAQIEQFQPQLIVAIHAPYGLLDFDGPPPAPNKLGSLYLDQVGVYPGSLGNFGGLMQRVPVVTVELKNALQVSSQEMGAIWNDLLRWMDRRLLGAPTLAVESGAGSADER